MPNFKNALKHLLKPVISFALKRAISIQDILEIAKSCMIEAAKDEIQISGDSANVSKVSVMTGLHRREVTRLLTEDVKISEPISLTSRVAGQWESDKRFRTKNGEAKVLSCDGNTSEFAKLVRLVSKDVHPGTVLFELKRQDMIEEEKGGIRLKKHASSIKIDPEKAFGAVSVDFSDLLSAVDENMQALSDTPHLQARTEFDNIFLDDLAGIKEWILKEGSEFHHRVRSYLSQFDKDFNPHIKKEAGGKVSISAFSFTSKRK